MSNTGHKNISASFDTEGNPWRYQVTVQWDGEIRRANLIGATLQEALEVRRSFELELDKPRTELHIRSNQVGVWLSEDGHGNKSWVAQCGPHKRWFSVKMFGDQAREMANRAREEMERKVFE